MNFDCTGDLYPDTVSAVPATTAKEWMQGRNVQPNMMSMQTGHAVDAASLAASKKSCNNNVAPASGQNDSNKMTNGGTAKAETIKLNGNSDEKVASKQQTDNNNMHNNHQNECNKENDNKYDNNSKKFAFLAQQTIPDYRSQAVSHL